jgi:hypothetical protein
LKRIYESHCIITGEILSGPNALQIHHLFCKNRFPSLKLSLLNGIPMKKEKHLLFHKRFGMNVTVNDFLIFLVEEQKYEPFLNAKNFGLLENWFNFLNSELLLEMTEFDLNQINE